MKQGKLIVLAFFLPSLFCQAQDKDSAGKPAQPAPSAAQPGPAASTVSAVTPPVLAAGAAADTYVIGASDVIAVSVWKEPTLSGNLLVRPDGMISLPLLGDVQASGLTPLQLADQIATKLKKFIQDPNVSVVVSQIHSKVVYLLGEVGKKGPIEMTPDMTLLEAIGSAGGITEFANAKKIYILRDEAGKHEKIPVHYKEALKGDGALNLVLKPGDTIVVP
jgi:polysaccharide export outer membrane protein